MASTAKSARRVRVQMYAVEEDSNRVLNEDSREFKKLPRLRQGLRRLKNKFTGIFGGMMHFLKAYLVHFHMSYSFLLLHTCWENK